MTDDTALRNALNTLSIPELDMDLDSLGAIKYVEMQGKQAKVELELGFPVAGYESQLKTLIAEQLRNQGVAEELELKITCVTPEPSGGAKRIPGVKQLICVASGKGGVGKSTTAVNLALALQIEGARVGLLDADIYGPSQPLMLGVPEGTHPEILNGNQWIPVKAHGLQSMSIGYLADEKTPMVWRGPMAGGALQQLINQTAWDNLDYLIVDMPPGTGDIQLTLAQQAPVSGAVIVTTPQDIALLDAKKGIEMFRKVNIPVLGVVENMAIHICSQCGHQEPIFGSGGGDKIATEYHTTLLGSLPLTMDIRMQADGGTPSVIADPEGEVAAIYRAVARKMAAILWQQESGRSSSMPTISMSDD